MSDAHWYSCPRCGEPHVISRVTVDQVVTHDVPVRCARCKRSSPMREWIVRRVRPVSVFRDVSGF